MSGRWAKKGCKTWRQTLVDVAVATISCTSKKSTKKKFKKRMETRFRQALLCFCTALFTRSLTRLLQVSSKKSIRIHLSLLSQIEIGLDFRITTRTAVKLGNTRYGSPKTSVVSANEKQSNNSLENKLSHSWNFFLIRLKKNAICRTPGRNQIKSIWWIETDQTRQLIQVENWSISSPNRSRSGKQNKNYWDHWLFIFFMNYQFSGHQTVQWYWRTCIWIRLDQKRSDCRKCGKLSNPPRVLMVTETSRTVGLSLNHRRLPIHCETRCSFASSLNIYWNALENRANQLNPSTTKKLTSFRFKGSSFIAVTEQWESATQVVLIVSFFFFNCIFYQERDN